MAKQLYGHETGTAQMAEHYQLHGLKKGTAQMSNKLHVPAMAQPNG